MSGWWLCGFCVVTLNLMVVTSEVDLNSQIRVAQCRASCIVEMQLYKNVTQASCMLNQDCHQCWWMCERLGVGEQHSRLCSPSCPSACWAACRFYLHPHVQKPTFNHFHNDYLELTGSGVSWRPQQVKEPFDLVVNLVLPSGLQTLDSHVRGVRGEPSLRVLAVNALAEVKVLSLPQESPLRTVRAIIRSLGLGLHPLYRRLAATSSSNVYRSVSTNETAVRTWRLRLESLVAQSSLVLVSLSWDHQQLTPGDQLTYLVTWEMEGGIIHGNLLTNTTSVTLSLWPETEYTVQVSILDPESAGSHSEPIVVNTHHILIESPVSRHHVSDRQFQAQLVTAAVAILFLATLIVTWRWQHRLSLPHSKLVDEEIGTPNLYRVFPPVVRLIGERQKSSPDVFASTDNLLQYN